MSTKSSRLSQLFLTRLDTAVINEKNLNRRKALGFVLVSQFACQCFLRTLLIHAPSSPCSIFSRLAARREGPISTCISAPSFVTGRLSPVSRTTVHCGSIHKVLRLFVSPQHLVLACLSDGSSNSGHSSTVQERSPPDLCLLDDFCS